MQLSGSFVDICVVWNLVFRNPLCLYLGFCHALSNVGSNALLLSDSQCRCDLLLELPIGDEVGRGSENYRGRRSRLMETETTRRTSLLGTLKTCFMQL